MQEGDVQIKGYPVRLPLDVLLVFSANPEDYTARGKIVTPSRTASAPRFARTIPPRRGRHGDHRPGSLDQRNGHQLQIPNFIREVSSIPPSSRAKTNVSTSAPA